MLDDLPDLANLKERYGFSWNNIFKLYDYGVKTPESITQEIYEKVFKESYGINKVRLRKAYVKLLREKEKEDIFNNSNSR